VKIPLRRKYQQEIKIGTDNLLPELPSAILEIGDSVSAVYDLCRKVWRPSKFLGTRLLCFPLNFLPREPVEWKKPQIVEPVAHLVSPKS